MSAAIGASATEARTYTATDSLGVMRLDDEGVPPPTGELEEITGETVVLALGQDVDRSLLDTVPGLSLASGVVQVDDTMMTGCPGVFAGGDAVPQAAGGRHACGGDV